MDFPSFSSLDNHESPDIEDGSKTSLRSGTGAPIFEHGGVTRIRRNPVRAIAALTWDGGPREIFGQVVNVSLTGCLLKTSATIETGTELKITITIVAADTDAEYELRAVVRRNTTADGRPAYGLEFRTERPQQRRAARALYSATAR